MVVVRNSQTLSTLGLAESMYYTLEHDMFKHTQDPENHSYPVTTLVVETFNRNNVICQATKAPCRQQILLPSSTQPQVSYSYIIFHLICLYSRARWGIKVVICPFRGTRP